MKIESEIELTGKELAEMFISWSDDEQAAFLNFVGKSFKDADFNDELQCCSIVDYINDYGKRFIYTLANFIKVNKIPSTSGHFDMLINTYQDSI